MFFGDIFAANTDIDATNRDVLQPPRRGLHALRRGVANQPDQLRQRHGADQVVISEAPPVGKCDQVFLRQQLDDVRIQLDLAADVRQEPRHQRLETAPDRIAEARVRAHRRANRLKCTFDNFLEVRQRHPAPKPGRFHLAQRHRPQLLVVRNREVFGDACAPDLINELFEILDLACLSCGAVGDFHGTVRTAVLDRIGLGLRRFGRRRLRLAQCAESRFHRTDDTLLDYRRRQSVQCALKRITREHVLAVNPGFAVLPVKVRPQQLIVEFQHVRIIREHDVAGMVERESMVLD